MSRRPHYNDRHRDGPRNENNSHLIGSQVSVVQKQDQGTGHLTQGIVSQILTNSASHPRGIKVRLVDGAVGRIADGSSSQQQNDNSYSHATEDSAPPAPQRASLADYMVVPLSSASRTIHPPSAEWPCPACTFVNSGLLPECELCQTPRGRET
jgi:uncharacterized repeat protein (TIGR03833 family)